MHFSHVETFWRPHKGCPLHVGSSHCFCLYLLSLTYRTKNIVQPVWQKIFRKGEFIDTWALCVAKSTRKVPTAWVQHIHAHLAGKLNNKSRNDIEYKTTFTFPQTNSARKGQLNNVDRSIAQPMEGNPVWENIVDVD